MNCHCKASLGSSSRGPNLTLFKYCYTLRKGALSWRYPASHWRQSLADTVSETSRMPRVSRALAWLDVLDVCQDMRRYVSEP